VRSIAIIGWAAALLSVSASRLAAQTQDDFFDDTYIHELRLEMNAKDWQTLKDHFLENTYYDADLHWIFNGKDIPLTDCAIRSRGHGSRSPIKPNLRVDINRNVPQRVFLGDQATHTGLASFILKANNQDASMMKERPIFKLFDRVGLPASREAYTKLYVNGAYIGVYLLTEELRTEYEVRYLPDNGGDLYEWKPISSPQTPIPEGYHFEWYSSCAKDQLACSTDQAKWHDVPFNPEENKSTFDLGPTINMIRTINATDASSFESTMANLMDLKVWVQHNAIENYVADFDAILGDVFGMNNFWLYRYKNSNFHQVLLWDKDAAYAGPGNSDSAAHRPIFFHTGDRSDPSPPAWQNVLMKKTLAVPARRTQWLEALYKTAVLAGGPGGWLEWETNRNYNIAHQAILDDTNKQYEVDGIMHDNTNDIFEQWVLDDYAFIRARNPFVLSALTDAGIQFPSSPNIFDGGASNAAFKSTVIAPGSLISIYGSGFSNDVILAPATGWPTTLGGITVFINGFAAPIQFVSPGQINVQVPWELGQGNGSAPITVMVNGSSSAKGTRASSPINNTFSNSTTAQVKLYAPGIHAVAQGDFTPLSSKPAKAGDVLVMFVNGLGPVDNQPASGAVTAAVANAKQKPTVTIGGIQADVQFAGLVPPFVGAYQMNVVVPPGVPSGSANLIVTSGGVSSQAFSIPVQ
jgi:uncharacterized protein (TIGR03437 family)